MVYFLRSISNLLRFWRSPSGLMGSINGTWEAFFEQSRMVDSSFSRTGNTYNFIRIQPIWRRAERCLRRENKGAIRNERATYEYQGFKDVLFHSRRCMHADPPRRQRSIKARNNANNVTNTQSTINGKRIYNSKQFSQRLKFTVAELGPAYDWK